MKGGKCSTCLWWWDLYDTGERKCYKRESRLFHEATGAETKCEHHETITIARRDLRLGTYKNRKKEACCGET